MKRTDQCMYPTYTYMRPFHGHTILNGGHTIFERRSWSYHCGKGHTIVAEAFSGRPEPPDEVGGIDEKANLCPSLELVFIAPNAD
jgi:hypothetical protein